MFDELANSLIQESFRPIRAKERIKELIKTPEGAFKYALKIKKGRAPELEPNILKNPGAAVQYAAFVIKDRWPEAEPYIKNGDIRSWVDYKKHFNIKD